MLVRTHLHTGARVPVYKGGMADVHTLENVTLNTGETACIDTGVSIEIPDGYIGLICGRSSTIYKYGIVVHMGIIDSGYCGPEDTIRIIATANRLTAIPAGSPIAQFGIFRQDRLEFLLQNEPIRRYNRGGIWSKI